MAVKMKSVEAAINSVGPDDAFPGEFEVLLSTPALDRDGDRLKSDGWITPLPNRIQFNTDHSMLVEHTVGSGAPTINEAGNLVVRGHYASTDHAQTTRKLVREGHIDSVSVTYRETKGGKRELINGAFVVIPSNPEAKVLASKALGGEPETDSDDDLLLKEVSDPDIIAMYMKSDLEGKSLWQLATRLVALGGAGLTEKAGLADVGSGVFAPAELVQAIHDASNNLGAACITMAEATAAGEGSWQFLSAEDGTCTAALHLDGKVYTGRIPSDLLGVKGDSPTPTEPVPSDEDRADSGADLVKLKARAFALGNHE